MFHSIVRFIVRVYTDPDTGWTWIAKLSEKRKAREEELLKAERKAREEELLYRNYKGYPPDWLERRERTRKRYDYTCQVCGRRENFWNLHVHHIIPLSQGGNHALENLTLLCKKCHGKQPGHYKFK